MEQTQQTEPAEFVKVHARDDRKAYNRQYYLQHREEIKARARQRDEAHKEVEREKARMRYQLKRDRAAAAAVAIASSQERSTLNLHAHTLSERVWEAPLLKKNSVQRK